MTKDNDFRRAVHKAAAKLVKQATSEPANSANDGDVRECVSVNGVLIDLEDVSHHLRSQYRSASRSVGMHAEARDELKDVGERMLAEVFPKMAMKAAIRSGGISGHDAVARLMGFKKKS
jgi:hypothetical protein